MTGLLANGVRLSLVLRNTGMDMLDNIRSDRAQEDGRNGVGSSRGSTIFADDGDGRSRGHFVRSVCLSERDVSKLDVLQYNRGYLEIDM